MRQSQLTVSRMPNTISIHRITVERISALFVALFLVLSLAGVARAGGRAGAAPAWADISGTTVYDREHLWAYISAHAVNSGHIDDAEAIAATIEQLYREDGYFLARVEVRRDPRQGLVEFAIREGRVSTIAIEGFEPPIVAKLHAYFDQAVGGGPVRLDKFERAVALAGDLAGVAVRTEFADEAPDGSSTLKVIGRAITQRGSLTVDNPPRRLGKSASAFLTQELYSTFTGGDMLRLSIAGNKVFRHDDKTLYGGVHYRAPFGGLGSYFELFAGNSLARRNFNGTLEDSSQHGLNAIALVGHPIIRDLHQFLFVLAELDYLRGKTVTSGGGLASQASVSRGSLVYGLVQDGGGTMVTGMTVSFGRAHQDPNQGYVPVDRNFWHVRAGFGWLRPLDAILPELAFRTEVIGQFTSSRLPDVEKFYLGDRHRMRGYNFAEFEASAGATGTFELSRHFSFGGANLFGVTPYAFVDAGVVRLRDQIGVGKIDRGLVSVGFGAKASAFNRVALNSWLAFPLSRGASGKTPSPAAYVSLTTFW